MNLALAGAIFGQFEKMLVDGGVGGEFGMEGGREDFAVFDESGLAIKFCEDGDARSDFFDDGAANEDHFERIFFERARTEEDVAGELAPVAVAKDGHVEEFEGILGRIFHFRGQKNRAGAGAENSVAVRGEFADGVVETLFLEELELRGAFAAGENKAVAAVEIRDGADFDGGGTERVEHGGVGLEITLDGEDADFHGCVT